MTRLQAGNNAETTLNGSILNSDLSLIVASATGFPTAPFLITIESEIIRVTVVAGTTFTIERGEESTSAAAHTSGVAIENRWTAGTFDEIYEYIDLNDNTDFTDTLTLTATNISNKYIDLTHIPINGVTVDVLPYGGIRQLYTTDFTIITDGADIKRLNWNGLGMESLVAEADIIVVNYLYKT